MSPVGGGARRLTGILLYAGALAGACALSALSYFALVVRENAVAQKTAVLVDQADAQLERARQYLARHPADKLMGQSVTEIAAQLKRRIPYGPQDLTVGGYLDQAAAQAGILDVKWSVVGGLKVPPPLGGDKRTPEQRLAVDPDKLKSSVIDVAFTSRYKEFLFFLRGLSEAPWPMEVMVASISQVAPPKVDVKLQVRYLYESAYDSGRR